MCVRVSGSSQMPETSTGERGGLMCVLSEAPSRTCLTRSLLLVSAYRQWDIKTAITVSFSSPPAHSTDVCAAQRKRPQNDCRRQELGGEARRIGGKRAAIPSPPCEMGAASRGLQTPSHKSWSDTELAYVAQRALHEGPGAGQEKDGRGTGEGRKRDGRRTGAGCEMRAGRADQCAGVAGHRRASVVGLRAAGREVVVGRSDPRRGMRGGPVVSGGTTTWAGR